ncbi:MAG: NUDIX hydrolase [Dehalococcoidales bacterium]|nr:NUDIX hydrolase [Dehalococcoidales bacterium]
MTEEVISSRTIFEGRILKLRVDTVRTIDGRESTREVVEHSPCIAVVPVDGHGNVLLVRQYRQAIGKELLEVPAGGIDEGETPEEAVIREMQEETGYRPRKTVRLAGFYLTPGFSDEYLHLFLSTDLVPGRLHAEDTPGIELVPVPVADIPALLASGKIEDSKTYAGLLMYLQYQNSDKGKTQKS